MTTPTPLEIERAVYLPRIGTVHPLAWDGKDVWLAAQWLKEWVEENEDVGLISTYLLFERLEQAFGASRPDGVSSGLEQSGENLDNSPSLRENSRPDKPPKKVKP